MGQQKHDSRHHGHHDILRQGDLRQRQFQHGPETCAANPALVEQRVQDAERITSIKMSVTEFVSQGRACRNIREAQPLLNEGVDVAPGRPRPGHQVVRAVRHGEAAHVEQLEE